MRVGASERRWSRPGEAHLPIGFTRATGRPPHPPRMIRSTRTRNTLGLLPCAKELISWRQREREATLIRRGCTRERGPSRARRRGARHGRHGPPAAARIEFRKDRLAQPRGQAPPVTRLLVQFRRTRTRRGGRGSPATRAAAWRCGCAWSGRSRSAPRGGHPRGSAGPAAQQRPRARVEDDGPIAISKNANDPGVSEQYAIKQKDDHDIDAPGAWNKRTSCAKVAVLDTGVQTDHPDLKSNLWENTKDPSNGRDDDDNGVVDDRFGGDLVDGRAPATTSTATARTSPASSARAATTTAASRACAGA